MTEDNKTKKSAPISLNANDLVGIKQDAITNMIDKEDNVGIFEMVDETYAKTYPRDLESFVQNAKGMWEGDFYVIVAHKTDPMLDKLFVKNGKLVMTDTDKCPTPNPGHHVYKYDKRSDSYNLLWAIPNEFYIQFIKDNILDVSDILKELIDNIYSYEDGTFHRLQASLNGEQPKSKPLDINNLTEAQIEALANLGNLKMDLDHA